MVKILKKIGYILLWTTGILFALVILLLTMGYLLNDSVDYTDRKIIQKITGVKIPEYKILDTKTTHLSDFDSEVTMSTTIEFIDIPDQDFFISLDKKINNTATEGAEEDLGEWTREGIHYKYAILPMGAKSDFVRADGFFFLYIDKGSKKAHLTYGNY